METQPFEDKKKKLQSAHNHKIALHRQIIMLVLNGRCICGCGDYKDNPDCHGVECNCCGELYCYDTLEEVAYSVKKISRKRK